MLYAGQGAQSVGCEQAESLAEGCAKGSTPDSWPGGGRDQVTCQG